MYSVLIQNQKTMESFYQFYPIFMEAVNDGKIGVCQWLEAGTTIDTTVPELYSLTNDKEEWRAVIVRVEEDGAGTFPASPANPYDFLENAAADPRTKESPIPLVRLTQMLGGVPAPQMQFECDIISEEDKAPRMIYRPVVNREDELVYKQLNEKYHFYGCPPTEIILVSLRTKQDTRVESVRRVWHQAKEADSSEFWKRNGYPSTCRFLFYEVEEKGPVQRTADLFKVWTGVMLLALNEIDPSTLQAYKLHRLEVDFDKQDMCDILQRCAGRVLSARHFISKSIQREIEQQINEETVLPDYRLEAPVVLKLPPRSKLFVKPGAFKLTAHTSTSDMETWREMQQTAQAGVRSVSTCAERALDRTADRMRRYCKYTESEILPLDAYQTEDLTGELDQLYDSILELRSGLPCGESADMERMEELGKAVKEKILKRITTRQAIGSWAAAAGMFFLGLVPAVRFLQQRGWGSWQGILMAALAGMVVLAAAEVTALLIQKTELRSLVGRFNSFVNGFVTRVSENTAVFSRYMSEMTSYTHGNSYLTLMRRKTFLRNESQFYKQNHITALNTFLVDLKTWSVAFHLPVNLEAVEIDEGLVVDAEVAPCANPLYTFESQASYTVPVNFAGDVIESPFGFISRLHIMREELYDDTR